MRGLRLSPRWCNRLIVLLLCIAPLVYCFGLYFFGLNGAHASTGFDTDMVKTFFVNDNFLTGIGSSVCANPSSVYGFNPFAQFIGFIDTNMLHFYSNSVYWGLFMYGLAYWIMHVLLLDLGFYGITFIIRLFFNILNIFERRAE